MPESSCHTIRLPRFSCTRQAIAQEKPFVVSVADAIAEVDAAAWDTVTAGQSWFLSRAWLNCLEDAPPGNMRFRYGLLWNDHRPIAIFRAQLIEISWEQLDQMHTDGARSPWWQRVAMHARNTALGLLGRRVLVCGDQFATGPYGIAFARGQETPALREQLLRTIRDLRWPDGRPADYFVCEEWDVDTPPPLPVQAHRFGRLPTEPNMVLHIDRAWRTYEDYLNALKAKYRKAARRAHTEITSAGASLVDLTDLAPEAATLHALYAQVEQHAVVRFGTLPQEHLPRLADALGPERFRCKALTWQGTTIGFATLILDGETAVAHVVGFDYEANARMPVYLRLLHALIDMAIAAGCRRLSFGRTALEPKARLGAVAVPMEVYVRHRHPLINRAAQALLHVIPRAQAPRRHPFKTDSTTT